MGVVRAVVAATVAVALVVVTPVAASAAQGVPAGIVSAVDPEDWPFPEEWTQPARPEDLAAGKQPKQKNGATWKYDASKSKWRGYMINLTSSVLGAATPKKWQAEQIANQYAQKGMPSGEQLNSQYGYTSVRVDPTTGRTYASAARGTGTYDDVVIDEYERQLAGDSKRKPVAAPAAKANNLAKTAGGALLGITGLALIPVIGKAGGDIAGGFLGFDADAAVCTNYGNDGLGTAVQLITGRDCDMWRLANDYVPNADAEGSHEMYYNGSYFSVASSGPRTDGGMYVCITGANPGNGFQVDLRARYKNGASGWASVFWTKIAECSTNGWWSHSLLAGVEGFRMVKTTGPGAGVVAESYEVKGDPERFFECILYAEDGRAVANIGTTYRESDGFVAPPECGSIPDSDFVPERVEIKEHGNGATPTTVYDEQTTDEYKDWVKANPECSTGVCLLDLLIAGKDDVYVSCFDLDDGCDGWWEDDEKEDTYLCRYGAKKVDLRECAVYAGLFKPGRAAVGGAYSDPSTGEWSGGTNSPRESTEVMSKTLTDPSLKSCENVNKGWNVVATAMSAGQCVLEWAFVPRTTVVDATFAGAGEAWDGKPPAVLAGWAGNLQLTPHASGCSKQVTLFGVTFPILDNCPGSIMSSITPISRLLAFVGMLFIVIVVLRRQVAGMVGYNRGES